MLYQVIVHAENGIEFAKYDDIYAPDEESAEAHARTRFIEENAIAGANVVSGELLILCEATPLSQEH